MYWSLWGFTQTGEPLIENVSEEWLDARVNGHPEEIIFYAELDTDFDKEWNHNQMAGIGRVQIINDPPGPWETGWPKD